MDKETFKKTVTNWWQEFDPPRRAGETTKGPSLRGDLAELRRCGSSDDVIFCAGFQRLWTLLLRKDLVRIGDEQWVAVAAGVLAHVETDDPGTPFPVRMAKPSKDGTDSPVSDLRFRKLLRATDREDLFKQLSRTVRLLRGSADVGSLALDIYQLCAPFHETKRRDWALAYYEAAPPQTSNKK